MVRFFHGSVNTNDPPFSFQIPFVRLEHYSGRTETAYIDWIKRFILFHGKRHPAEMGAEEVRQRAAVLPLRFFGYIVAHAEIA